MKHEYKEADGYIKGVKGEKTIYNESINDIQVLVTRQPTDSNKEDYFNVYFIDPIFKTEPMNNLQEQIPVENKPKDWKEYLTLQYVQYFAWRQFNLEVSVELA